MTVDPAASSPYRVVNPVDGTLVETFAQAADAEIEQAVTSAQRAFESWSEEPIERRGEYVRRIARAFSARREELAGIITLEMGKPRSEAEAEVDFCTDIFDYYAEHGASLAADREIDTFSRDRAVIQHLPVGPLLGIMPWNYPYYQVARFAAPNLMLGNTILLKHAESCPRSALAIQSIMDDAGLPAGAYGTVFASHEQVAGIIADPRVQGVSLTGSERAGAVIGELAGKHLKKAVLELGGSDPFIVLDSEDVAAIADTAWAVRIENTGQACNSNKRMIVAEEIYDEFVRELIARAEGLVPGDPAEELPGTFAPLSSRRAAEQLDEQVRDAVAKGATLHVGGELFDGPGSYYSPAVLTGVTPEMRAYREELFGPVAVVYRASSEEEAIRLANDSVYGLGGSVFSQDEARAARVARRLRTGMAHVNVAQAETAQMPFGGVKRSGYGRELGPLGMDEFVNKRLFYVAR